MRKTLLMILLIIMTLSLALPLAAQDDNIWYVYLLDTVDNRLLQVNQDGATTEYTLPIPEHGYIATETGFGADGRFMSYCVGVQENVFATGAAYSAHVVDIVGGAVLRSFDFGQVQNCVANRFSADSALLSVGLMNRFPGDPNADLSLPVWELHVYNIVSGERITMLNSQDPIAAGVTMFDEAFEDSPIMPRAIEVSETEVVFMAYPGVGMGGPAELNVYRWNIAGGTLEPMPQRGVLNSDSLDATGELVIPAYDPNLPAGEPGGPMPAFNTVRLSDAGGTRTIYQNSEKIITTTTFVNDAEVIAVTLLDSFDPEQMEQHNTLILIDREGNIVQTVAEYSGYVQPFAAPGGFLLMYDIPQEQTPPLFTLEYHGKDGSSRQLWSFTPGETGTFWQLIYVSA